MRLIGLLGLLLAGPVRAETGEPVVVSRDTPAYIGFGAPEYTVASWEPEAWITLARHGEFRQRSEVVVQALLEETTSPIEVHVTFDPGEGFLAISIPLGTTGAAPGERRIELRLSEPGFNVFITEGAAVLRVINPELELGGVSDDGTIWIAWSAQLRDYVLEHSPHLAGTGWQEVSTPYYAEGDRWRVAQPLSGPSGFYRLRRTFP